MFESRETIRDMHDRKNQDDVNTSYIEHNQGNTIEMLRNEQFQTQRMLSKFIREVFVDYDSHSSSTPIPDQLEVLKYHIEQLQTKKRSKKLVKDIDKNERERSRSNSKVRIGAARRTHSNAGNNPNLMSMSAMSKSPTAPLRSMNSQSKMSYVNSLQNFSKREETISQNVSIQNPNHLSWHHIPNRGGSVLSTAERLAKQQI